mgnify:CR=1 FL=1
MLLIFGWMLIGSAFIVAGWVRQAWRYRRPVSAYNAALVLSVGLDLLALGMALQLYSRIGQILEGAQLASNDPLYFIGAALVMAGKTAFVWIAALKDGRRYSAPFWWSYWAAIAAWSLFVLLRSI